MRILFSTIAKVLSTGLSTFLDNFSARSNTSGGLGTATDGNVWKSVNGTINVVSGAAKASSTPTTYSAGSAYPLSTVNMSKSDVQIKLKGTNQGSTAAIWVQSTDEWWGITARAVQTSTPGNTNYGFTTYISGYTPAYGTYYYNYNYSTTTYGTPSFTNYKQVAYFVYGFNKSTSYSVSGYNVSYSANYGTRYNSKYSIAYTKYTWATYGANYSSSSNYGYKVNSTYYGYDSYTGYYYNTYVSNGTGTGSAPAFVGDYANYSWTWAVTGTNATTYAVNQYVDVIKSTASAVTTMSSWLVSTAQTIGSILVSISNNQITTKPYSDTGLVSQIGSDLVYTATGAVISTQFGISVSPSQYNQSDIIGTSVEINAL